MKIKIKIKINMRYLTRILSGLNDIFYRHLDACYYVDNIIYFFSRKFICKFDFIKK